jgi:hypothetical protein
MTNNNNNQMLFCWCVLVYAKEHNETFSPSADGIMGEGAGRLDAPPTFTTPEGASDGLFSYIFYFWYWSRLYVYTYIIYQI